METKTKKQVVDSIKDNLFHQVCRRLSDFSSYDDGYISPVNILLYLDSDDYQFLCREVLDEKN